MSLQFIFTVEELIEKNSENSLFLRGYHFFICSLDFFTE